VQYCTSAIALWSGSCNRLTTEHATEFVWL